MIFSFISFRPRRWALAARVGVALVAVPVVGCTRADTPTTQAIATPHADGARAAAEVIGALKLVRQEYANAVSPAGGAVADATEYAETELFAEQAEAKFAALAAGGGVADDRAAAIREGIAATRAAIARHAPPTEVASSTTRTLALVEELLAGAVPEDIRGAVLATGRADQAIAAEEIVGEYRVGVFSGPAQAIFERRDGEPRRTMDEPWKNAYLGVLLRERRTKRFLPAAEVTAVLEREGSREEIALTEAWGDFHQYGANIMLPPDGPVTITVRASAPAYARHGDMLTHFVTPVSATIRGSIRDRALHFDARPVQAIDPDYAIGDDVLQALTEAGTLHDVGPYRIGLIVEGPEPVWAWKDGAPVLVPVTANATNHVEVVLVDRETGQLVPRAAVTVTFLGGDRELATVMLRPLLSIFAHYGETLALPAETTRVRVHVDPPALRYLPRPRLGVPGDVDLPLPPKREAHA
jgi:hypothetical protein